MRANRNLVVSAAILLSACEGTITEEDPVNNDPRGHYNDGDSDATPSGNAPLVHFDFEPSSANLLNPERGYYVGYDLTRPERAASVRESGHSLAISVVHLDAYRDSSLPSSLLATLDTGFAAARGAGIKIVLRFSYNSSFSADASRSRILGHISQLTPLLQRHADVIAVMQAGFIGAWGEWHSSTNGLDNPTDRAAILAALLEALPAERQIQVRRPMFKEAAYPGGALEPGEAYDGSPRARLGHHNDCYLASNSDYGTYAAPVDQWQAYVAGDGRFTAVGGETCAVYAPRSDCSAALAILASDHTSYLNRQYNRAVLDLWDAQGCGQEIEQRLGHRFALAHVAHTETVAPGGELDVEITVRNHGFASPFNFRPVELLLRGGDTTRVVRLSGADARRWAAGAATTLAVRLRIPADLTPGAYQLALRLPDAAESLAGDARYAIRLANDDTWDAATASNLLSDVVVIDVEAPGRRDPAAREFTELP
jgi:hypothetical protein